jgi:hypothetical protein
MEKMVLEDSGGPYSRKRYTIDFDNREIPRKTFQGLRFWEVVVLLFRLRKYLLNGGHIYIAMNWNPHLEHDSVFRRAG